MKVIIFAVLGFAAGMGVAHFLQKNPSFRTALTVPALETSALTKAFTEAINQAAKSISQTRPQTGLPEPTLRVVMTPAYDVLFGKLDDTRAITSAIQETAELEKLLVAAPRDEMCDAARGVAAVMKAACLETERTLKLNARPISKTLGGGQESQDFFGGLHEGRWRENMAVLEKKAALEWQRFTAIEATAAYPPDLRSSIEKLLAERHQRHLQRTEILMNATVKQVFNDGAIVHRDIGDNVFVQGVSGFPEGTDIRVFVHEDGIFRCTDPEGAPMSLRKFRLFRNE